MFTFFRQRTELPELSFDRPQSRENFTIGLPTHPHDISDGIQLNPFQFTAAQINDARTIKPAIWCGNRNQSAVICTYRMLIHINWGQAEGAANRNRLFRSACYWLSHQTNLILLAELDDQILAIRIL